MSLNAYSIPQGNDTVVHYEAINWSNKYLNILMRDKIGLEASIYDASILLGL